MPAKLELVLAPDHVPVMEFGPISFIVGSWSIWNVPSLQFPAVPLLCRYKAADDAVSAGSHVERSSFMAFVVVRVIVFPLDGVPLWVLIVGVVITRQ